VPDAADIARRAVEIASSYIENESKRLADMAGGDTTLLRDAARIVQEQPPAANSGGLSAEHLAFNLITAAHELVRHKPPA
jgi:hypothetical protein